MIALEPRIRQAAELLLDREHVSFARRLGLTQRTCEQLTSQEMGEAIFAIDELTWSTDGDEQRLAVQLIAVLWELSEQVVRQQLREFFIISLSRLGVAPATIMVDAAYRDSATYGALGSYAAQLAATALQLDNVRRIGGKSYQLTEFQVRVLDAIEENGLTGISAPTSAGKSFALCLAIARHARQSNLPVIYIVPTISLVNQVAGDLRRLFESHALESWLVATTYVPVASGAVFVLTQERASLAIEAGLGDSMLGMLIVDEVQNIERVGADGDLRSKVLFDFLQEIRVGKAAQKIVLSGPRLADVGAVGAHIFGTDSAEAVATLSPVAGITYSIEKRPSGAYFNQHRETLGTIKSLAIDQEGPLTGFGLSLYDDAFHAYLEFLVNGLTTATKKLIFSPTSPQARRTAGFLANGRSASTVTPGRKSLGDYLESSVHPNYSLIAAVREGVAFHTGRVPPHARLAVEQAFADGLLDTVVCTTTLMQGVNLPADVVLVRNPNLYVKKDASREAVQLSAYDFANLRGRAGRLLKSFVGRTVVLDEASFSRDAQQGTLFADATKALRPGYAEMFDASRDEVMEELRAPGTASGPAAKFLASHIRQTLFRRGEDARDRLAATGIVVDSNVLRRALQSVEELTIARDVVLRNRYWDPFDLQLIKDSLEGGVIPALPNDIWFKDGVAGAVSELLRFQHVVSPAYYQRYIGKSASDKYFYYLAKSAESWGRETPLRTILEDRHFSGDVATAIDDQVGVIYQDVVYGVTALLKPIADIQESGQALLAAFESGVWHPTTRLLTGYGIYRETAVQVKRKLLASVARDDPDRERVAFDKIQSGLAKLDYWTHRQVTDVLGNRIRRGDG